MNINAKGIFRMTQWALPALVKSKGTVLNIVSNASHMPMTTSLAYNASKGAAHIMTLQLARELSKRHGITVFGISPNKLKGTEMSKDIEEQVIKHRGWTREYAEQYQINALLAGEETDPAQLAEFIAFLLSTKPRHKFLTGCILPYGA
jgi:NAD(P)-dependent dehydrogenase (short-subunit alcohol dehydrogenase family)